MIDHLYTVSAAGNDPRINLAAESALMDRVRKNEMILYLWQNDNTVVIGRNQNVFRECSLVNMQKDHVTLVRRSSGGGAVYHDLGNLNFTFLTDDANYDVAKQSQVIVKALEKAGLHAEISGRNDLLLNGFKFSGNAYYHHGGFSYHHGTLLISSDLSKMPLYLNPDPLKLKANGVTSMRSRVANLSDFRKDLNIDMLKAYLIEAAQEVYGCSAEETSFPDEKSLDAYLRLYSSQEWIYGKNPPFDIRFEKRFAWGSVQLGLRIVKGMIQECVIHSDAMDPDEIERIANLLSGCAFERMAMVNQIPQDSEIGRDLSEWIREQEF